MGFFPGEVSMVFGRQILQYTKALCQGHYDYLDHLPDSLPLRILNYLELQDVGHLGQTSRRFRQVSLRATKKEMLLQKNNNFILMQKNITSIGFTWTHLEFVYATNKLTIIKITG